MLSLIFWPLHSPLLGGRSILEAKLPHQMKYLSIWRWDGGLNSLVLADHFSSVLPSVPSIFGYIFFLFLMQRS